MSINKAPLDEVTYATNLGEKLGFSFHGASVVKPNSSPYCEELISENIVDLITLYGVHPFMFYFFFGSNSYSSCLPIDRLASWLAVMQQTIAIKEVEVNTCGFMLDVNIGLALTRH